MEKLISNKRILKFMLRQEQPFWKRIQFGKNVYILTFEYNLYQLTEVK